MKRIKILVIVVMLLFMSGCTVKYNVTIKEEITATELDTYLGETPYKTVSTKFKKYSSIAKFKGYTYKSVDKSNESGMYLSNTYYNICDYINYNSASLYIFDSMKCTEKDEYYEIINDGDYLGGCMNCPDEANIIDKLYITFNLPKKALISNADKVINNKYTWVINKMNTQDKDFILRIDKSSFVSQKTNNDLYIYIIIGLIILPIAYFIIKILAMGLKNKY